MKKGKLTLALVSAAALLLILLLAVRTIPKSGSTAPVEIRAGQETLQVWTGDGENYYAFLPGHARMEEAVLLPLQDEVRLEGETLPLSCGILAPEEQYSLTWQEGDVIRVGSLCILTASGTATLHIDTQSGSMDYIHEEKGNAERGTLRLYDEAGVLNFRGSLAAIRGRGNSTWVVHEKKPYILELTEEAALLGMGSAQKWVLLADALDASALRNKIVYDAAAQAGLAHTPQTRWTEVYLNGEYAGLYLLCEKIDAELLELGPDGAVVCMDRDIRVEEDPDPYLVTNAKQYLQVRACSDLGALKTQIQDLENALLSEDGDWQRSIDLDSWVKKYLVEEIFGSYDAGFQSQYFYCNETGSGSRVYAGPVWDFDSSLGNPSVWALNSPRGLYAWRPAAMAGYETPWYHALYQKPEFRQALAEEYRRTFLPLLQALPEKICSEYAARIAPAFARNRIRWDVETEGIFEEAEQIARYLQERTEFLSVLLLEERSFCILRLQEGQTGGYYGYYAVEPGTVFEDLPRRSGTDFLGWYREDTQEIFDASMPVTEDLQLYPRYEGGIPAEAASGSGMKELLLTGYHYVPAAVLVLLGLVLVPLALRRSRAPKKKTPSRAG